MNWRIAVCIGVAALWTTVAIAATTTKPSTEPAADDAATGPRVAYIDLGSPISEKPSDFGFLISAQSNTLRSVLDRLETARNDKEIKAVLITLGGDGPNLSQALELRDEMSLVRAAGKRIYIYADAYDAPGYILASGASDVCVMEGGEIELPGVGLETMFAKGLFDKIGVEADFEQIGEFKGADEEYIHTKPSAEMSGELNKLVDGLYLQLVDNIATNRKLSHEAVEKIVDQALIPGKQAKELGLVDHLVDVDGLRDLMGDDLGGKVDLIHDYGKSEKDNVDLSSPFALFSLLTKKPETSDKPAVALIYADGVIVDGSTGDSLLGSSGNIGSEDFRRAVRLAERDDSIQAIVLRIDSPGGSALASEAMWQAVRRVGKSKPVIVSVGSMAASGGYYLASSSNYIFADPTAIVGSIGVVGGKFVLSGLYDKLGLSTASFSRGANAGLFSSDKPWTDEQRKQVHDWMQQTYEQFTTRVMTTRKGKIADIDKVARGRIWLAPQAKELGLVDAIGGVNDAIVYAAKQADMAPGSYEVRVVPAPRTLADLFTDNADSRMNIEPHEMAGNSLLGLLPARDRASLEQEITVLRMMQERPVSLVCPYVISTR
jgi:protease-4